MFYLMVFIYALAAHGFVLLAGRRMLSSTPLAQAERLTHCWQTFRLLAAQAF
jgi:hypothetical protein